MTKKKNNSGSGSATSVETDGAVYFWKPEGPHGWMGQWHECAFRDDTDPSIVYKTAEHYMMYQKALLFNDPEVGAEVLTATSPKTVKALGRKVRNFDEGVWVANRERIVRQGNVCKFTLAVRPEDAVDLKAKLLATADKKLVEASPLDRIWGVGFGPKNAEANRAKWGLNLLGKALMEVREELRKGDAEEKKAA